MTEAELRSAFERIDAMSERCEHVISRNRPLTLDTPPKRKVRNLAKPVIMPRLEQRPAVACGELTGNEMRMSNGYSPRPRERDDCDPDGMWADFESEFDDMVAGMR